MVLSDNALFLYDDKCETATMTQSSEAGSLVAENVQDFDVQKVWRATGDTNEWIAFDFGATRQIETIALINHNCTLDGELQILIGDDPTFAVNAFNEVFAAWEPAYGFADVGYGDDGYGGYPSLTVFNDFRPIRLIRLSAQASGRYMKIFIADPTNPLNYVQVGKIMAGIGRQPEWNFAQGWELDWKDQGDQVAMEGGSAIGRPKGRYRTLMLPFEDLTRSELLGWVDDIKRICGTTRPLLISGSPSIPVERYRMTIYGFLTGDAASRFVQVEANAWSPTFRENWG